MKHMTVIIEKGLTDVVGKPFRIKRKKNIAY